MYNFEKFTKRGSKTGNYTISFTASKTFGFNSGFYLKENLGRYKKVVLFYDKKAHAVAFKFTNDEKAEGGFAMIHSNNGSTGAVSARSFILSNDLDKNQYHGKKRPKRIREAQFGTLYVIDLTEKEA